MVCAVVSDIKKVNKHKVSFGQGKRKRGQEKKGKERRGRISTNIVQSYRPCLSLQVEYNVLSYGHLKQVLLQTREHSISMRRGRQRRERVM